MKRVVLLLAILGISNVYFGQNTECDKLKTENNTLKTANSTLNEENSYLKRILDINKAVTSTNANHFDFKITKVVGDLTSKTIFITLLIENNNNEDMKLSTTDAFIIDIEGNNPDRNYYKEVNIYPELKKRVPTKVIYAFNYNDFDTEPPRIIKIFNLKYEYSKAYELPNRGQVKMRDINVTWK